MTPYKLLHERCGITLAAAAQMHATTPETVAAWIGGSTPAPAAELLQLRLLLLSIHEGAKKTAARLEARMRNASRRRARAPELVPLEISMATTDAEAQRLGWPCVGTHRAMVAEALGLANVPTTLVAYGTETKTRALVAAAMALANPEQPATMQ